MSVKPLVKSKYRSQGNEADTKMLCIKPTVKPIESVVWFGNGNPYEADNNMAKFVAKLGYF